MPQALLSNAIVAEWDTRDTTSLYLSRAVTAGELSMPVANRVRQCIALLAFPSLPLPDISVQEPDRVLCFWDQAEHHFEMEIRGQQPIELFYRDRTTGYCWEAEWNEPADAFPDTAFDYLAAFIRL